MTLNTAECVDPQWNHELIVMWSKLTMLQQENKGNAVSSLDKMDYLVCCFSSRSCSRARQANMTKPCGKT